MITQSSKSVSDSIPVDLLIDIFSRVPAKSVARFRCVSKFWKSILGGPYFSELFLTKAIARPRIFFVLEVIEKVFAWEVNKKLLVFFSPQPQNPRENSSLVATSYKAFPKCFPTKVCTPIYGLALLRNWESKSKTGVICNPVTGESITLPKVKGKGIRQSHFGFDPINKQFKVLYMNYETSDILVLTLETGKLLWRPIQDPLPFHYSRLYHPNEVCINGVVYYQNCFEATTKIVCFDFRSETYGLINMYNDDMLPYQDFTLFNYKGHLGAHQHPTYPWYQDEFVWWVLEDAGKHEWSKRICKLPPLGIEGIKYNKFVGMTGTGELVFSPQYPSNPFYIFYYNVERETFTRFNIQGFEKFEQKFPRKFKQKLKQKLKHEDIFVHTFLDYVENMKFM